MKKFVSEGVSFKNDVYTFNYTKDNVSDAIKLEAIKNKIYFNTKLNVKIFYGYSFQQQVPNDIKRDFLHKLKENKINKFDYNNFILSAIKRFSTAVDLKNIDAILTPKSGSPLASDIAKHIHSLTTKSILINDAIVKNTIDKIKIDFDTYNKNAKTDQEKEKRKKQLERDYKYATKDGNFQIKKVFKSRAKFFHNFLSLNPQQTKILDNIQNSNILIVDDYKVSGITTEELIKTIQVLNPKQITIFVLIKK